MKKTAITLALFLLVNMLYAQDLYYKGEWKRTNTKEVFTFFCRLNVNDSSKVSGEILWTYVAIDSTRTDLMALYNGKEGKMGIEYVEGTADFSNDDFYFEGKRKTDPDNIIGLDKYTLKISSDGMLIFGKSDANGQNNGLLYARKLKRRKAQKGIKALIDKIK